MANGMGGKAQSEVHLGETPPDDITVLWYNYKEALIRYFDLVQGMWMPYNGGGGAVGSVVVRAELNCTNGQTAFVLPNLNGGTVSVLAVTAARMPLYAAQYTLSGNTLTLTLPFQLDIDDKVIVIYKNA